jgi:phosphate transport system protein
MDKLSISAHISHQYNAELEDIRSKVLAMGGLVEQQLDHAITALVEGNIDLGELVLTTDYKINAMEVEIDEECTHIIARRQPTASDLRLIMAVIKTITDLERIGDEAERIGRMAVQLAKVGTLKKQCLELENMGTQVKKILHESLDAFARSDPQAALEVARSDLRIDRQYESIMRQLITFMMEDPRSIPRALDVIWSARALERIGDRARNICEYVIYLVKGKDVRHTSLEQIEQETLRSHGGP